MTDIFEAESVNDSVSSYKELLTSTISEGYPKYMQDSLLKKNGEGGGFAFKKEEEDTSRQRYP